MPARRARAQCARCRHRSQLKGPTATVAALAAVSGALSGHLCDAAPTLVAEVTMVKPGVPHARGDANVTVGLYPELSRQARLQRIAAELARPPPLGAPGGADNGPCRRGDAGSDIALGRQPL